VDPVTGGPASTTHSLALCRRPVGMVGLPILVLTVYILWIWPRPVSTSFWVEVSPYLISLLTGLPFAIGLGRAIHHTLSVMLAYLGTGFVVLWVYAMVVLCLFRGMCL
jgi:hypothetical protein